MANWDTKNRMHKTNGNEGNIHFYPKQNSWLGTAHEKKYAKYTIYTRPKWKHEIKTIRPHRNKMCAHFTVWNLSAYICAPALKCTNDVRDDYLGNVTKMWFSFECNRWVYVWFNSHIAANHNLIFSTKQYQPESRFTVPFSLLINGNYVYSCKLRRVTAAATATAFCFYVLATIRFDCADLYQNNPFDVISLWRDRELGFCDVFYSNLKCENDTTETSNEWYLRVKK